MFPAQLENEHGFEIALLHENVKIMWTKTANLSDA